MELKINNKSVSCTVGIAEKFISRLRGWMFKKSVTCDETLVISPCNSIHTFFMNFPIDVIFIDYDHKIIKIENSVLKNRIIPPVKGGYYVIEACSGFAEKENIMIGDMIELIK